MLPIGRTTHILTVVKHFDKMSKKEKICFVIMPISDQDGYDFSAFLMLEI